MKGSWDDYSQYLEKQEMFQTTNQFSYHLTLQMSDDFAKG
jgi:hypothetical protein